MRKSALFALSLLGLFDSSYLWWSYTSPSQPMVCLGTGCDVVRASRFATLWGSPLPFYGFVMYLALALLIFCEPLLSGRLQASLRRVVVGIAGAGFLVSLYLTGIEAFSLHAWCVWCVVSAISITLLLLFALWDLRDRTSLVEPSDALSQVRKQFAVFVVALVIGIPATFFLFTTPPSQARAPASVLPSTLLQHLVRPDSYVAGNPKARVTVVEFADFECPYCKRAEQAAREIRKEFGSQIRFVFRQFPLRAIHPQAEKAAEASECAGEQGKFWESVDMFYDHQNDLRPAALERYARQMGLNSSRFDQCLSSGRMARRVNQDIADGRALGVRATPTFFIGDRKIEGPLQVNQFSRLIEQQLAAHGTTLAKENTETPAIPPRKSSPPNGASSQTAPSPQATRKASSGQGTVPTSMTVASANSGSQGFMGGSTGGAFSSFGGPSTACSEDEAKGPQPTLIHTPQAKRLFESHPSALFVDVRETKHFDRTRIRGAINVPLSRIETLVRRLPKDREIVLYESGRAAGDICASSRAAGRYLLAHGFVPNRVLVYQDGLAAWEKAGLPIQR